MTAEDNKDPEKRTIVFMNSIPVCVWRGGEKWMVNAAAGLCGRGHRVICVGRKKALWLQKAGARGVETREYPIHADLDPCVIARLFAFFKKNRPDVLCCNFEKDVRLGGVAAKMAGVKRVFVRKGLSLMYDKLRYRLAYRYVVDDIITPAAFIKKQFAAFSWLDQRRIHVVPNGVEMPYTRGWDRGKLRAIAGVKDSGPIVFGAGTIFSQKGFEYLVEAVSLLRRRGIGAHGAIAGSGGGETITALAQNSGVASYVHLLGYREDVRELMYGADVFALSSIDEGLPNVVLEAMSVGTPVVAADAGGASEIITDGVDGFVVPVRDAQALADRIGELLENKALLATIGAAGRENVRKRFSIGQMIDCIEKLFLRRTEQKSCRC